MEWQTPAVSEKFQSRFGRPPGTADSADTGGGALTSDRTEGDAFSSSLPALCVTSWGFTVSFLWMMLLLHLTACIYALE
jgi:hypothetical protein